MWCSILGNIRAAPSCPICDDVRQYVRWSGQEWTTFEELRKTHRNVFMEEGGLTGIGIEPAFAIGQRALVIPTPDGAVLWDCVSLITEEAVERIRCLGGLKAIAISHPALLLGARRMERSV